MKANTQGLSLELRITAFGLILKELLTLSGPNEVYNRTDLQKICLMIS